MKRDHIFKKLDEMKDELDFSPEESRATVEEIIHVLKGKNITFQCAREILIATQRALDEMSRSLQL